MSSENRKKVNQKKPRLYIISNAGRAVLGGIKLLHAASREGMRRLANRAPERAMVCAEDGLLRPRLLTDFIGQEQARTNLSVFIAAARARKDALDHTLLVSPPGLGKTSLAQIVARELGANFRASSGPVITGAADIVALFADLRPGDVLFVDEIHRLRPAVEELFYPIMDDYRLDLFDNKGRIARPVKMILPRFTLIGATTRAGLLTGPLKHRFGITIQLRFYSDREMEEIVARGATLLSIGITPDGIGEIARRARGTPRIGLRLLRRVRDFSAVEKRNEIDRTIANRALLALEVDTVGLDATDRRYLSAIALNFEGGPVGLDTISAALSEPSDAIEEIEPYLIQIGFLARTLRGRVLTPRAFEHLGLAAPIGRTVEENLNLDRPPSARRVLH
jgi:Holliday junction DNA helicase RuvB